jgi:hypothetical protein
MNKLSKKQVTFYVDENILFNFKRRFPHLSANFFRRCMVLALNDSNFFQTVFMSSDELLNSKMDV